MGYRIDYQPVKKLHFLHQRFSLTAALTGVFALAFFIAVEARWPEGRAVLQEFLLPGDGTVTAAAMEDLAEELQAGGSLKDALSLFFRQIMEGRCLAPD